MEDTPLTEFQGPNLLVAHSQQETAAALKGLYRLSTEMVACMLVPVMVDFLIEAAHWQKNDFIL